MKRLARHRVGRSLYHFIETSWCSLPGVTLLHPEIHLSSRALARMDTMEISIKNIASATEGRTQIGEDWMSGSAPRNLILGQPVLTWLKYWGDQHGFKPDPEENSFFQFVTEQGNFFEAHWTKHICCDDAVRVMDDDKDVQFVGSFLKTIAEMMKHTPVILHGALWWAPERIHGATDVLCLESWLYAKFPKLKPADFNPSNDAYCVVDVKFTSDLESKKKQSDLEIYSAQVRLYSYMVGQIQGRMPNRAFLATRDSLDCPIAVDVCHRLDEPLDPYLADLRERFLHIKLHGDRLLPWRDSEVAVGDFADDKHQEPYAKAIREIGDSKMGGRPLEWLPYVGKNVARQFKHIGYRHIEDMLAVDPATIPLGEIKGIGAATAPRIRAVLRANKYGHPPKVPADLIPMQASKEFFLDYEYLNNLSVKWERWPDLSGCPMIFLAGVGWMDDDKWQYREFIASEESKEADREMLLELIDFFSRSGRVSR